MCSAPPGVPLVSDAGLQILYDFQRRQLALLDLVVAVATERQALRKDAAGQALASVTTLRFDEGELPGLAALLFGLVPVGCVALRSLLRRIDLGSEASYNIRDLERIRSWSAVRTGQLALHSVLDKLEQLLRSRQRLGAGQVSAADALLAAKDSWFRGGSGGLDSVNDPVQITCMQSAIRLLSRHLTSSKPQLAPIIAELRSLADEAARSADAAALTRPDATNALMLLRPAAGAGAAIDIGGVPCCRHDLADGGCPGALDGTCPLHHSTHVAVSSPQFLAQLRVLRHQPGTGLRSQRVAMAVRVAEGKPRYSSSRGSKKTERKDDAPAAQRGTGKQGAREPPTGCPQGHCVRAHHGACVCAKQHPEYHTMQPRPLCCGRPTAECWVTRVFMEERKRAADLGLPGAGAN